MKTYQFYITLADKLNNGWVDTRTVFALEDIASYELEIPVSNATIEHHFSCIELIASSLHLDYSELKSISSSYMNSFSNLKGILAHLNCSWLLLNLNQYEIEELSTIASEIKKAIFTTKPLKESLENICGIKLPRTNKAYTTRNVFGEKGLKTDAEFTINLGSKGINCYVSRVVIDDQIISYEILIDY